MAAHTKVRCGNKLDCARDRKSLCCARGMSEKEGAGEVGRGRVIRALWARPQNWDFIPRGGSPWVQRGRSSGL